MYCAVKFSKKVSNTRINFHDLLNRKKELDSNGGLRIAGQRPTSLTGTESRPTSLTVDCCIPSIAPVLTGNKLAIEKYNSKLQVAYAVAAHQGLASGLGLGTVLTSSSLAMDSPYGTVQN
ncbi:ABC-type xenobiotic transporter [Sarracenia purpurea var. burkii]